MSLIDERFEHLRDKGEAAFIPFVVLGDPDYDTSARVLEVLAKHGDLLELGFPFSDPIADGPRIQAADQRALQAGITPDDCLSLIRKVSGNVPSLPICLLLYYNLIHARGSGAFIRDARDAGVDGVLVADMPVEESDELQEICRDRGMDQVFIIAPTTTDDRMELILSRVRGFIYVVAVVGVTGEREKVQERTLKLIEQIREQSDVPICVGFGISKPEHVREIVDAGADGVIVGSAIEAIIEEHQDNPDTMLNKLEEFTRSMKEATRRSSGGASV